MSTSDTRLRADFLKYSDTIGLATMEGRGFYYPSDVAIGGNGRLYVVSRSPDAFPRGVRVTVTNLDHEYFGTFGSFGEGDGQFIWPTSITVDSHGLVYLSDEDTHRITVYDPSGEFLSRWGVHGSAPGEINGPSGIAFDGEDNLYVVDQFNNRIQKFTKDGRYLFSFGSAGDGDGQFNLPWGMTVAPNGDAYVADWRNGRIQRFSPDGEFLARYGSEGQGDGEFRRPSGVAVDREGYVYVADWGNERIQVLDPEGGFVMKLRGEATLSKWAREYFSGQVQEAEARARSNLEPVPEPSIEDPHDESSRIEKYFWGPVSVKLDSADRLYVVDSNRHRVQVYRRGP